MDRDPFTQFVEEPSPENFLAIRNFVINHPSWAPYGQGLDRLNQCLDGEEYKKVVELAGSLLPDCLLSPSFHMMVRYALQQLGDDNANIEGFLALRCIEGIKSTGSGTEEAPWLVTRTRDEYDVLQELNKGLKQQALVRQGARQLDRMECSDGSVYYFDVTDCLAKFEEGLQG